MSEYTDIFNLRGHSYNEACLLQPGVREAERSALVDLLKVAPGQIVGDAPAGGGYLADGIWERFGDAVEVICIEPSEKFGAAIRPVFRTLQEALDAVESLADGGLDALGSLAGLHHFLDKRPVFREWARLVRPGGILAVADVGEGTGTGRFLNEFVDRHTPGGHDGRFFGEGEFSRLLDEAGFDAVSEGRRIVPWRLPGAEAMAAFCRSLFSVQAASLDQVAGALRSMVGVDDLPGGGVAVRWELQYAAGVRRGGGQF